MFRAPSAVIILINAGPPVDQMIESLANLLEPGVLYDRSCDVQSDRPITKRSGDLIIDGGNEWYLNTKRRGDALKAKVMI